MVSGNCTSGATGAFLSKTATQTTHLAYTIDGATATVTCANASTVWINSDMTSCFLYSTESDLPAVPVEIPCV
jgi:hypothetical protein